jgi:hypothetical protein
MRKNWKKITIELQYGCRSNTKTITVESNAVNYNGGQVALKIKEKWYPINSIAQNIKCFLISLRKHFFLQNIINLNTN